MEDKTMAKDANLSIRVDKEVTLHSKVDQHPVTTCKYKKIKLLIQD